MCSDFRGHSLDHCTVWHFGTNRKWPHNEESSLRSDTTDMRSEVVASNLCFLAHSRISTGFFFFLTELSGPSWLNQGWGLGFPLYPLLGPGTSFWLIGLWRIMVAGGGKSMD